MPMTATDVANRLRRGGIGVLLLALTVFGVALPGAAPAAAMAWPPAVPPLSPGLARLWIYRDYEPYDSLARPYWRLNGVIAGISEPGGAMYRDLRPGVYRVTVDCEGMDVDQFVTVGLAAGQQVFVKVLSNVHWDSGGFHGGQYQRDTFYTWQVAPPLAIAEMARVPLYNGS
jgi:hypothetical protein